VAHNSASTSASIAQHFQRTPFKGDGERVFCHARRDTPYSSEIWAPYFKAALKAAGVEGHVFHRTFYRPERTSEGLSRR
jgi:hypothetical protein